MACAGAWSYGISTAAASALEPSHEVSTRQAAPPAGLLADEPLGPPVDPAAVAAFARFAEIAALPTATATASPAPTPTRAAPRVQPTPVPATSTPVPPPPPAETAGLDTSPMDAYSRALFEATNRRRASQGLPALRENGQLNGIARIRAQDMARNNYFAHTSPVTGENPFTLMDKYGVPYGWAGENLAKNNYPDSEMVAVADEALWNSPSHRENILNPNYTDMGVALAVDGTGLKYFAMIYTGPP